VPPLEAKNNYFVNPKTGNKFQIVGMAYQPGGSAGYKPEQGIDPLSDPEVCLRDAALMQLLGMNTIRVYNLDPKLNHDECVSIFNAGGMYMLIDVNSPKVGEALTSEKVWESYYASYLERTFAIVEAFKDYPNTLAFFSGNEVIDKPENGESVPPYIRSVTRDLKNYVKNHAKRPIPVGYSAADVRKILYDSWNYLQCAMDGDDDDMSKADLFALNSYSWCGESTFKESGFDTLVDGFKNTSVPVFFSEYGCNTPSPRVWGEVHSIYGPDMTDVFSGGVVYEYTQEKNNYGLVEFNDDGSVSMLEDFTALAEQLGKIDFKAVQSQKPPSGPFPKAPACSSKLITTKNFATNFTIPAVPPGAQKLIDDGIKNPPSGKLVEVTKFKVDLKVKTTNGDLVKDLTLVKVDDDSFITDPSSATADTDSAAGRGSVPALGAMALGAVALMFGFIL